MQKVGCFIRGVIVGGNANNGSNAGLFYTNVTNTPSSSNSNRGSRQYFQKRNEATTSPLGEKRQFVNYSVGRLVRCMDGLPIGNYLSQPLANLSLTYIMHWVNEIVKVKVSEYADDIVFFSESKTQLHAVLKELGEKLADIGLRMKENWQIFPIAMCASNRIGRALDYVGFCFYRLHIAMRKSIKQNFCRRVAKLNKKEMTLKEYKQSIAGWLGWAKYSDSKNLLKRVIRIDYYKLVA